MDKYKSYLKKLRELKDPDKAKGTIQLLEAINTETPEPQKREAIEQSIDLIEAELTANDTREVLRSALKAKHVQEFGPFVEDWTDTWVVFELESGQNWKADYSISNGKVVFEEAIKVIQRTVYDPMTESKKNRYGQYDMFQKEIDQQITGDFIKLIEAKAKDDGTIPIKIVGPGWGSSGYYSEKMLERDAHNYEAGTQMFIDHPTASEEIERPERSNRDLAAVTVTEGYYDKEGSAGAGIYADAKVFSHHEEMITEMAPHIGLSHIAFGRATIGEAEGEKGTIIESINKVQSIDFVTKGGAGGQIIQMFEAARNNKPIKKMAENKGESQELTQMKETNTILTDELQKLKGKALLSDAREFVEKALKDSGLPDLAKDRLKESLSAKPDVNDKGEMDELKYLESIKNAVKKESEYLASLSESGKIKGMGGGGGSDDDTEKLLESIEDSFKDLGYDDKMVKILAKGRN